MVREQFPVLHLITLLLLMTEDLQQDLAALEDWEKQWQIAFHPEKCVVIQISSKRSTISANYTLHNHQLDVVDSSKYLGVTINKNLRWEDHINNITARANRTLGFLKRNLRLPSEWHFLAVCL
jgi:hypothetical protein